MISLILPYWRRAAATDEALRVMAGLYLDADLEVVLVDDGSGDGYEPPDYPLEVKVVRLPGKSGPLNPCVPYNRGVREAKGEYIALSNPEILHRRPILEEMAAEVEAWGRDAYVIAACWSPEESRWHCHSSRERSDDNDVGAYVPRGADYHFMTLLHRELWEKTGGFDEDYRLGAGYDDPDFVRRLHQAGAKFIRRDDLVVDHPRNGAHAKWTREMFARNRAIFTRKWAPLEKVAA